MDYNAIVKNERILKNQIRQVANWAIENNVMSAIDGLGAADLNELQRNIETAAKQPCEAFQVLLRIGARAVVMDIVHQMAAEKAKNN